MQKMKWVVVLLSSLLLAGCVSSLLIGNRVQSKLMWAFLEPLVGFNPNEINFFEAPLIKDRMTALLGDKYESVMQLLHTANEIQQEGALYYVVSRYAPSEIQSVVDTAGMVWNADTNQLAVMLIKDGVPEVVSEQAESAKQALVPTLPTELKSVYDEALAIKNSVDAKEQQLQDVEKILNQPEDSLEQLIKQKSQELPDAVDANL